MLIKHRIYLSLLMLSLLPLGLFSLLTEQMSEGTLRQSIENGFNNIAREKANSIDRYLDERINETRLLASHPSIIDAVQKANDRYQGQDEKRALDKINRLDKEWISSKGNTERAKRILNNDVSRFLRNTQASKPDLYGEIFITDRLGANVAMTKATSDYYQADEYWWQEGSQNSQGTFLDDRGFDASVGAIVIGIVVPVIDDGEVIGVFKINFKVSSILNIVSGDGLKLGSEILLVRSDGSIITRSNEKEAGMLTKDEMGLVAAEEKAELSKEALDNRGILAVRHAMKHKFSTRQTKGAIRGIAGEQTLTKTWFVVYEINQAMAFASLYKLREASIGMALGAFFLVIFIGLSLSRAVTRPLSAIKKGTEIIAGGNLDHRIALETKSEFNSLAASFNNMTQNLQKTLASRDEKEAQLNKLAQAVEQSSESITITNLDAEMEYVNEAFVQITGHSREELIGKSLRILQSGKTPHETYVSLWDALTHGRIWKGELYNRRKDGTEFTELATISPIRQRDGSISHYVAIKEDITEQKQLAEELENHREHLEKLVEERTREVAEERERAENANQAKSIFLANMSHEIRTPMNAIIGLTRLLQREGPKPEHADRLNKIDQSAQHLLSIINDILDISKIEAGKLVLEQKDFHLDAIFDQILSVLKDQATDKGLIIEVDKNAVPIWLRGDSTRLRQALLNYAGNAIKFTEEGTIFLRSKKLEERDGKILVRFEVQDTGVGIEPDRLSDMFHAFEQKDASTTREHGGTGLGLTINAHLAELMGGEVGAESQPGQGSTFWFTVWLERGHGIQQNKPSTVINDAETELREYYAGSTILLVEDNAINREVAEELLCGVGLSVDAAENGLEALKKVRTTDYDLVLMDVQMPIMDGLEATRLIRSTTGKADIPILAMTANIFESDRQACREAGMNAFVSKPFDLEVFFSILIQWLPKPTTLVETSAALANSQRLPEVTTPAAKQGDSLINPVTLRKLLGNDVSKHLPILKKFIPQADDIVTKINAACSAQDAEQVCFHAHELKSSARTVGADALADLCQVLEKAGRAGDWLAIDNLYSELTPAMEMVSDFINGL